MNLIDYALEYEKLGFFVLPLIPGEKNPYVKWKYRREDRPKADEIKAWWQQYPQAQIGMVCGKYSGVDIIDFDGVEVRPLFESLISDLPETYSQTTGRLDGGEHVFFKHNGAAFKNISKPLLPDGRKINVDLRTNGGLIVLAPSVHKSGKRYEWGDLNPLNMDCLEDELCDMPPDAVAFFEKSSNGGADNEEGKRVDIDNVLQGVPQGSRDNALFSYACSARARSLKYSEAKLIILEAAKNCKPPISETIALQKLDQGWKYEPGKSVEAVLEEPLKIIDIKKDNSSLLLDIPDLILKTPGLVQEGLELLYERGLPDIPQLNIPSILTVLANIISTKICYNKMYCNLFTLKIGKTSMGKSRIDDELTSEISAAAMVNTELAARTKFITDFASGTALYRELERTSHLLVCIDEGTEIFRRYKTRNPVQEEKKTVLLTLYTKSGKPITKSYANKDNRIELADHCLSILMNATPVVFDEMDMADFETGFYQRVDMWCYEGKIPYWDNNVGRCGGSAIKQFIDHLSALAAINSDGGDGDVCDVVLFPREVSASAGFLKLLSAWSKDTIDLVNSYNEDAQGGLIARRFDLAIKYAIIHSGATRLGLEIYEPLETENLEWGIAVAKMLTNWKIEKLFSRMTTGDFDRDLEYFKRAIFKVMAAKGREPTFRYMMNRNKKMKNWSQKYSEEIIQMLQVRKEIITVDEQGKATRYYLAKT